MVLTLCQALLYALHIYLVTAALWGICYYPISILQKREQRQREVSFPKPFMATVPPGQNSSSGNHLFTKTTDLTGFPFPFIVEYFNGYKSKKNVIIKFHEFSLPSFINYQLMANLLHLYPLFPLNYSEANLRTSCLYVFHFVSLKNRDSSKTLTVKLSGHLKVFFNGNSIILNISYLMSIFAWLFYTFKIFAYLN